MHKASIVACCATRTSQSLSKLAITTCCHDCCYRSQLLLPAGPRMRLSIRITRQADGRVLNMCVAKAETNDNIAEDTDASSRFPPLPI